MPGIVDRRIEGAAKSKDGTGLSGLSARQRQSPAGGH
jgi:hypothetical protein